MKVLPVAVVFLSLPAAAWATEDMKVVSTIPTSVGTMPSNPKSEWARFYQVREDGALRFCYAIGDLTALETSVASCGGWKLTGEPDGSDAKSDAEFETGAPDGSDAKSDTRLQTVAPDGSDPSVVRPAINLKLEEDVSGEVPAQAISSQQEKASPENPDVNETMMEK